MEISAIEICNRALTEHLGINPIMSFDEKSAAARTCKQHYENARRDALTGTLWGFASVWKAGTRLDVEVKKPWQYVYAYPPDAMRVFEIQRDFADDPEIGFEVTDRPDNGAGKLIHTDHAAPVFVYSRDKDDPATFDQEFVTALAALLAYKMAMQLTKDVKLKQASMNEYARLRASAQSRTLNEGQKDQEAEGFHHRTRAW